MDSFLGREYAETEEKASMSGKIALMIFVFIVHLNARYMD
jgi:hypothetical protein